MRALVARARGACRCGRLDRWPHVAALAAGLWIGAAARPVATADAQEVRLEGGGMPLDEVPGQAKIESFEIVGAKALPASAIKRRLFTEASSGLPFFGKTWRLNKQEFLRDLRRVVVFYQQNGYFDADVEGYEIRPHEGGGVDLAILVNEGEPSTIDTLEVELGEPPEEPAPEEGEAAEHEDPTVEELIKRLPIEQGDVFSEARIDSAQAILTAEFQDRGHAFAEVLKEYRIDKDARSATVVFTIYPGEVYRFGRVRVTGETEVSEKLIRGQIRFQPGELFQIGKVHATQRRLYQLNLFRRVQVTPQYEAPLGDSLPVVIHVADAEDHLVRVGAGYGSEELVRVSASWLDRNFLGGARQAVVAGDYSQIRRGLSASLTQPNVLIDDLSATGTVFYSEEREDTYDLRRTGGRGRINHEVSPSLRTFYGFNIERDTFTDFDSLGIVEALVGQGFLNPSRLTYVEFGALVDTSDDIFSPTEGNVLSLNYHLAVAALAGDYRYHRATLLATHYQELRPGWVLAVKVLPGAIRTYGAHPEDGEELIDVPLFERLFVGGSTSVRGYRRRRLGPLDDNDNPVGGEASLETSVELRYPLFGKFRGVAFVDAGNVWPDTGDVSLGELRYTPGVGVRYETPIGPVRVDTGFKTRSEDPGPRFVVHLSVGNAF